jgi:alpha-D-ribose 1-methylphosphonate 5-triphosphate synthase subunit PhnG
MVEARFSMTDQFQELWLEARAEVLETWTDCLLKALGSVKVLVEPRPALVMMEARDSVEKERFCVGELLVTECQILVANKNYWGRVLGNQPLRAFGMAVLEAVEDCAPDSLDPLKERFQKEREFLVNQRAQTAKALGATKVQFDTMTAT